MSEPTTTLEDPATRRRKVRFSTLLATLFGFFLVTSVGELLNLAPDSLTVRLLVNGVLLFVLISATVAVSESRRTLRIARALAGVTIVLTVLEFFTQSAPTLIVSHTVVIAFFSWTCVLILRMILSVKRVDFEIIAASLCFYLLIGMLWAVAYSLFEYIQPDSFNVPAGADFEFGGGRTIHVLYYSYVTLTTLGYGDISPASGAVRMLAVLEAMIGQLFLVVLVARLVGLQVAQEASGSDSA